MYVSGLLVHNFRSLEDITIEFEPGLNALVGKNNAGKSNIVHALDFVLGEKWPTYRQIGDKTFFRADSSRESADWFLIVARLEGGGIDHDAASKLSERRTKVHSTKASPKWDEKLSDWIEETEGHQYNWMNYPAIAQDLEEAEAVYIFLSVPKGAARRERQYGLVYRKEKFWFYLPSFPGDLRDLLLTTAYVPAFRDPNRQLRINQYTWYGKLIQHLYEQQTDVQRRKIKEAQQTLSNVLREIFSDATNSLREQLARAVFHYEITFRPGAFTRDDDYKQITLFIDDGLDAPFYDKGSGIQSALILALFTHYCRSFHKGSSLLMIEEPEIYLHPQARRALEAQLVQFVNQGYQDDNQYNHQVIIATHSPEFLRSVSVDRLSLIRKPPGKTTTQVAQASDLAPRAEQIMETKNAEVFFADHVILVEGGEEYIVPVLADVALGERRWLDMHNVSVARVNGKGQFRAYVDVLDTFGIEWTILTDLDFLRDGVQHFSQMLNQEGEVSLGRLRETWNSISTLPKGKKIKKKVFNKDTRDWKQLYEAVERAIEDICSDHSISTERSEEIRVLWTSLRDRVHKANHERLREEGGNEIDTVVSQLKQEGIFVLSRGELEDYMTEQALALSGSKDLRAMKVSQELAQVSSIQEVEQWISCSEIVSLLGHVQKQVAAWRQTDGKDSSAYEVENITMEMDVTSFDELEETSLDKG